MNNASALFARLPSASSQKHNLKGDLEDQGETDYYVHGSPRTPSQLSAIWRALRCSPGFSCSTAQEFFAFAEMN
jgi:hypothetical protein